MVSADPAVAAAMSEIRSKVPTDDYRDGFDRIWGNKPEAAPVPPDCKLVPSETNKDDWALIQRAERSKA